MKKTVFSLLKTFSLKTVILSLLFFVLGLTVGNVIQSPVDDNQTSTRHMGRMKFTNPVVDLQSVNESTKEYAVAKKKLEGVVKEYVSNESVYAVSMYFQDLETSKWFAVNEDERYAPASLMKVTLLLAYYKVAETNPSLLDEIIINDGKYTTIANVPPAQRLAIDKAYTVNDLLYNMIVHSNNEAQHLLSDHLETRVTMETNTRLVYESTTIIPASYELGDLYDLTVADYAGVFRVLYNATYLSEAMSERALALLAESSFDSGIVNGIPENIVTANKFGFKDSEQYTDQMQFHDCGIIYAEPNPYILCIMTKTNDPAKAQKAVSELSSQVYENIVNKL